MASYPEFKITAGRVHFDGKNSKKSKATLCRLSAVYSSSKAIAIESNPYKISDGERMTIIGSNNF